MDRGVAFTLSLDLQCIGALAFPTDFSFRVGGREYPVPKMLAALLSPVVARILRADFLASSFDVDIDDPEGDFQIVMDLLLGKRADIPCSKIVFLSQVGNLIGNKQLMRIADTGWVDELTVDNAITAVKFYQDAGQPVPAEFLQFIAANIPEMDENGLKGLSCDLLCKIRRFAEFGKKDLLSGSIIQRMCNMMTCDAALKHAKAERRRKYVQRSLEFRYQSPTERSGVFSYIYEQCASNGGRWTDEVCFRGRGNQTLSVKFEDNMAVLENIRESPFTLDIEFSHKSLRPNGFVFRFSCPQFGGAACICRSFDGWEGQEFVPLLSGESQSSDGNQFVALNTEKTFQKLQLKFTFRNMPINGPLGGFGFGGSSSSMMAVPVTVSVELFGEMAEVT